MVAASLVSPTGKDTTAGHDPFSQTLTPVQILQPRATVPVVSLPQLIVHSDDQGSSDGLAVVGRQSLNDTTKRVNILSTDHDSKKRKVSYKIPRYTRRNQSRSEPSSKSSAAV